MGGETEADRASARRANAKRRKRRKRAAAAPDAGSPSAGSLSAGSLLADDATSFDNPYAAPQADIRTVGGQGELPAATKGQRFLHYVIDSGAMIALSWGLGTILVIFDAAGFVVEWPTLVWLMVYFGYYLVAEGMTGRTLGKLVTGARVVDTEGNRPAFGAILGRTLGRFVPFEGFSLIWRPDTAWHDSWSGTRVVVPRAERG